MAAKDDKNTIYGEPIDKDHIIEVAKKYNEAAGNYELKKKFVHEFLGELYTGRISIKEPRKTKKKDSAGEFAYLKFTMIKGVYGHLLEQGFGEEKQKDFVNDLFRQIVIFDMAKMVKRNIEGEERIDALEHDVQELRSKVALLEKSNGSNERLLMKVVMEMISIKKGVKHIKAAISRLKSDVFEN